MFYGALVEVCIGTKWLSFAAGISNLITYSCGSNRHYEITEKGVFLKVFHGIRGRFRAYRFKVEVYYTQIRETKFLVSLVSLLSCPVICHVNKCYYCIVRFIRNFSLPFLLLGDVLRGHLQHGQIYPS